MLKEEVEDEPQQEVVEMKEEDDRCSVFTSSMSPSKKSPKYIIKRKSRGKSSKNNQGLKHKQKKQKK